MPSATQKPEENVMAEEVASGAADDPRDDDRDNRDDHGSDRVPAPRDVKPDRGGFFHIYKSGQGYWTRMSTAAGAALLGLLTADFLYRQLPPQIKWLEKHHGVAMGIAAGFFVLFALLTWKIMNKPRNADFLIATDSEMKKVNWTSKKDLMGSTKVVIFFMFLIAFLLFAIDVIFGYVFYFVRILKSPPF